MQLKLKKEKKTFQLHAVDDSKNNDCERVMEFGSIEERFTDLHFNY
jgi:hypothetical protein